MKVRELISALRGCDPNANVFVASWRGRYGPLCRLVGDPRFVRLDVAEDADEEKPSTAIEDAWEAVYQQALDHYET